MRSLPFTVHRSPFTMRYPFTVNRVLELRAKGESRVKGQGLRVNGSGGAE